MASYGISTWDANGKYNNYGIKPVSVVGYIELANGQKTGSYSFSIPSGMKVGFALGIPNHSGTVSYRDKRRIVASGNTITIQATTGDGVNDYPAIAAMLIVFVENA